MKKTTRDLPDISGCHSCGLRTDACTGKNELQTLYSEWRLVLLCKKCISRIESSHTCSYCFKPLSQSKSKYKSNPNPNSVRCSQCNHLIHKSCFVNHDFDCNSREKGSVCCVDCWVPELIATRRGRLVASRRMRRRKREREDCDSDSSVFNVDYKKGLDDLKDSVKEAGCMVREKVEVAARARDLAVRKAIVAWKAADVAKIALSELAAKQPISVDDDEEEGDPEMETTDLFSKLCCVNFAVSNGNKCVSDPSDCASSSMDMGFLTFRKRVDDDVCGVWCDPPIVKDGYVQARVKEGEGNISDELMNGIVNACSEYKGNRSNSVADDDERYHRNPAQYLLKYSRRNYLFKYCRRKLNGRSIPKLTYYRRKIRGKSVPNVESKYLFEGLHPDGLVSATGVLPSCSKELGAFLTTSEQSCDLPMPRLTYCRKKINGKFMADGESKFLYEGLHPHILGSATGLLLSCPKESRSSSEVQQSCNLSLQASASSSVLSQDLS